MVTEETVARSGDTGRVVGGIAGVLTGAEIGTAVIPIPLVGTVMGAIAGGVLGSEGGRFLGRAVMNVTGTLVNTGALMLKPLASKLSGAQNSVKSES